MRQGEETTPEPATVGVHREPRRLVIGLEIVGVFAVGIVGVIIAGTLDPEELLRRQAVIWVTNVVMLAGVWLGLRFRGEGWSGIGMPIRMPRASSVVKAVLLSVGVVVIALGAFVLSGAAASGAAGASQQGADMSGYAFLQGNLGLFLLILAGVYLVSSLGEEVIYRGFLMTRLAQLGGGSKVAWTGALMVSATGFGLAHYSWGPVGMVQTGCMGLVLGGAYLAFRRNLWITILAHAYMDTLLFVSLYR